MKSVYGGSQFTSAEFIKVLAACEIKISMDGKGAWRDNVFVERLWWTTEYEEVYLRAGYTSVSEARASIRHYLGSSLRSKSLSSRGLRKLALGQRDQPPTG